jgi:hypothetical protein
MADASASVAMVMINMTVEPLLPTYGDKSYVAITTTTEVSCQWRNGAKSSGSAFDSLDTSANFAVLALARPWLWRRAASADDKARIAFKASVLPSRSDPTGRPEQALRVWLSKPLDDLATSRQRFATQPGWQHALENSLRQPGQLGWTLGLAHFVTGEPGEEFTEDEAATFARLVGAPDFDAISPEKGYVVRARASPMPDIEGYFAAASYKWDKPKRGPNDDAVDEYDYFSYTLGSDSPEIDLNSILLVARVHRYRKRTPISDEVHPAIDENMWVRFPDKYDAWSGRDWFSRLPMDVADAADLPKHFATGLMNWVKTNKSPPNDATIGSEQDQKALNLFFRLVVATYDFGARSTHEEPEEDDPEALNAPTESTAHTVVRALGLGDQDFARDPATLTDADVRKDLIVVWRSLVGNTTKPDDPNLPALAATLLAATLLRNAQDQATKDVVAQLFIAAQAKIVPGDIESNNWYKANIKQSMKDNVNDFHDLNHVGGDVGWSSFKFNWQSFSTFLQAAASGFRDAAAGGFVFNRWLAMTQGDDAVKALTARQAPALAALATIRLPQRLVLDGMQGLWADLVNDQTPLTPDGVDAPSVQRVRNKLRDLIEKRFDSAISVASADALLGTLDDKKSLRSSVQFEIDASVHRVGGDPDKRDTGKDDPNALELGSDVAVEVPQPLTFQVGAITGGDKDERDDLKQRFAGFGVLVRNASDHASSRDWHCLTLGQLVPRPPPLRCPRARCPIGSCAATIPGASSRRQGSTDGSCRSMAPPSPRGRSCSTPSRRPTPTGSPRTTS